MSKKQRSHGEQMATLAQITILYEIINMIFNKIKKLEIITAEDVRKEKESKNVK